MYPCVAETGSGAFFYPAMRTPYSKQHVTVPARGRCRLAELPRDQLDSQALPGVANSRPHGCEPTTPTRPTATHGC